MGKATEGYLRLLDDFGVFPKYVPQEKPKDKRVNGRIIVDGLVIRVWYSLGDFLYGNLVTNTVVRVDSKGMIAIPGRQTDIHFEHGKSEGTAPLNWKVPTDQKKWLKDTHVHSGVKMWKRTSNRMESSRPYMVKMDGVEMIQHGTERTLDSWINNYRKVFVEQPFRISKEVVEEKKLTKVEAKKEKKSKMKSAQELLKGMSIAELEALLKEME